MKVRTDAKRDAILETASKAFLELGYERTSMAEISARVGGSKATLYGYFPSKEALFQAVTHAVGTKYLEPALSEMAAEPGGEIALPLQRFGERMLAFICSADAMAAHRMVMAEAGHSDVGRLFYEAGPKQGVQAIGAYLRQAMEQGHLRTADPLLAAKHFLALVSAEMQQQWFHRSSPKLTRGQAKAMAERAVAVFLGGYGRR